MPKAQFTIAVFIWRFLEINAAFVSGKIYQLM